MLRSKIQNSMIFSPQKKKQLLANLSSLSGSYLKILAYMLEKEEVAFNDLPVDQQEKLLHSYEAKSIDTIQVSYRTFCQDIENDSRKVENTDVYQLFE